MDNHKKTNDDKFILMGLDEAGDLGEVLKNKTAKKILDFLGDVKEASEKDIADGLDVPINTVEYNLKKLIKAKLVEKTKNFFWSVKGKKIPMYKLAKKHIIIGTKKPSLNYIKTLFPVFIAAMALIAIVAIFMLQQESIDPSFDETQLRQFSSQSELNDFLEQGKELNEHLSYSGGFLERTLGGIAKGFGTTRMEMAVDGVSESAAPAANDFSTTNIQVEGVDEADIVKNDGKYIYVVSGNKVVIVNAYPAENMNVLSEIKLESNIQEIFINDDKLIVFGGYYGRDSSKSYIYDISDKENPELENEIEQEGQYVNSRMIGDYVYIINTKYTYSGNSEPPVYTVDGVEEKVMASEVYYLPHPDVGYVFTSIAVINVKNGDFDNEVYLTGRTNNVFVSQDNIYLTYTKYVNYEEYSKEIAEQVYLPLLSGKYDDKIKKVLDSNDDDWQKLRKMREIINDYSNELTGEEKSEFSKELLERLEDFEIKIQKEKEKTIIHKIKVSKMDIEYKENGVVPGHILNQFSMDEYKGNFRIATTTGSTGRFSSNSLNHLYILNEDLEIIGKVEDLAKGESIYSVRFMGKRAYVVTFKKIDPLFVIDVADPKNPEVLGYLKITGYSDYLHPYDENHIIGIGKETIGSESGNFAWYQGVKVSLFDVSDVENPIEKAKIEIGDRGTSSDALRNHKAVLFDREKGILVLPITLAEIDESKYEGKEISSNAYGQQVWQGAFVLDISLEGISERGRITHDNETPEKNEYGYMNFDYNKQIKRSLYMGDVLYTISNSIVKANELESLDEVNLVEWETDQSNLYYGIEEAMF
jgi:inhibitor of cysteine peptidase